MQAQVLGSALSSTQWARASSHQEGQGALLTQCRRQTQPTSQGQGGWAAPPLRLFLDLPFETSGGEGRHPGPLLVSVGSCSLAGTPPFQGDAEAGGAQPRSGAADPERRARVAAVPGESGSPEPGPRPPGSPTWQAGRVLWRLEAGRGWPVAPLQLCGEFLRLLRRALPRVRSLGKASWPLVPGSRALRWLPAPRATQPGLGGAASCPLG